MALLADFPSGMNITARTKESVMSALFVFVGSDVGRDRPSNSNEPDGAYSWQIPPG